MQHLPFDVRRSQWVRFMEDLQQEIHRHKWLESEKAGRDIGWEMARCDWMVRHAAHFKRHWLNQRRQAR